MATLSIRLLGGLTVEYAGHDRTAQFSGRLRALLAYLLLQPDRPHARQSIAFTLWPDSSDKQARTNLRKLLLLLRAALDDAAHYLEASDETICWRSDDASWVDVCDFQQTLADASAAQAQGTVNDALEALQRATALYRGDLLPDCYDEWIIAARESLRDAVINALDQLCTLLEGERRYAEGVTAARRLLQIDPIYERGYLHLVRQQALMNDRTGALQSYHRCATILRRELGVDPSPALEAFYLQLLDNPQPHTDPNSLAADGPGERGAAIPLVGRRSAWQQLLDRWQCAARGQAHFTLIVGEAGIGKSRLAEEMMLWVERQGNSTLHSRAYASDNRTLTFAPVAALLRAPVLREHILQLEPHWLTELARLLPELLLEQPHVQPPQPMLDDWQRHHLFAALTRALMPTRHPRLIVIDDLQWSDSETLAWLPHLLEQAKTARLLIVGTVRSEEFEDYAALQALCDTLRRRGQFDQIDLSPLDAAEIATLARHVTGRALPETHTAWLVGATAGNPLFVVETARLLQEGRHNLHLVQDPLGMSRSMRVSSDSSDPLLQMPKSVLSVIDARLARLSPPARTLAEVAATIGRSFDVSVLAAAAGLDEDALVDALDELWRRRIIRESADSERATTYDFSHDRIRDGAYAGISPLRRRLLHKRVAAAIVAHVASQSAPETDTETGTETGTGRGTFTAAGAGALDMVSGQLGHHFERAGERAAAVEHYLHAARVAAAQYAHHEAMYYLDRVLALALPTETALRFEALRRRDHVIELAGAAHVWEENLRQLCALAETPDPDPEVVLHRQAIAAERATRNCARVANATLASEQARIAVDYANQTQDKAVQALCHYQLGLRLWFVADFARAVPHIERAIDLARAIQDAETLALALELRAQTHMFSGGSAATIEALLAECLANYDKAGSLQGRVSILNKIGYLPFAQGTGRYEGACAAFNEAIELARQLGSPMLESTPQRNLAVALTCMGNYAAADEALQRAQAIRELIGEQGADGVLTNYFGFLYLSQGRLADALAAQQQALAGLAAHNLGQWRVKALTALAWIHLRLHQTGEGLAYAEIALAECEKLNEQRQAAYARIVRGILRTGLGELDAAHADFSAARTILLGYEMVNRAQEADAGLAYVALLAGEVDAARCGAHAILAHLAANPVDFTEDVCQVLLTCLRILQRTDTDALPRLAKLIDHHLTTRTATLDAASAKLFWQIDAHRELASALAVR